MVVLIGHVLPGPSLLCRMLGLHCTFIPLGDAHRPNMVLSMHRFGRHCSRFDRATPSAPPATIRQNMCSLPPAARRDASLRAWTSPRHRPISAAPSPTSPPALSGCRVGTSGLPAVRFSDDPEPYARSCLVPQNAISASVHGRISRRCLKVRQARLRRRSRRCSPVLAPRRRSQHPPRRWQRLLRPSRRVCSPTRRPALFRMLLARDATVSQGSHDEPLPPLCCRCRHRMCCRERHPY